MDKKPQMEKGFKSLTCWDTEQVYWQWVLVCSMIRKTHQGTEQAYWK
jgi:hypothetical protein